jgi:hypothetical protein
MNRADPTRRTALVAGVLYLVTFAASIPAALLLAPILTDPNYIAGPGVDSRIALACLLDLVNALAAIGTAVALFTVVRRQHEGLALGFVTTRMFEAGAIVVGIISLLAVITLRQTVASSGADPTAYVPVAQGLVAVRDWTFILGPGTAGLNALMIGTLMYRSRLVPRFIPTIGLIGAPIYYSAVLALVLGVDVPTVWYGIGGGCMFVWELLFGLWMTFKGFNRSAPIVAAAIAESQSAPAAPVAANAATPRTAPAGASI